MGCLKLTYHDQGRALEVNPFFLDRGLGKKRCAEKNCVSAYRYGFNGMEKDDEAKGNGNHYTTYWRQYDPRLGRWMSREPKPVAWESEYASFRNNPIYYADPNGDWVKGAGLLSNVFRSNERNEAKVEAGKHKGGDFSKVDGVWRATWTESNSVDFGDGSVKLDAFVMVEFKKNKAYGTVDDALYDFMADDPTGLGSINTGVGTWWHKGSKAVAGLNPLWSVPNAGKVLGENAGYELYGGGKPPTDLYGDEASSKIDVVMAAFSIAAPLNPGKSTALDVLDGVNTAAQVVHDLGIFDQFKEQESSKSK
jgi:RHS repeat-associated protein